MAVTYSRFVPGSSAGAVSSTVNSINGIARPRLVFPLMEKLDYIKTPITDKVKKGEAVDNPKVEWSSENYRSLVATGDASSYNSAVTTVNVAAGLGQRFMLNDVWQVVSTGEYFWVSAIATDALTVTRAFGGTTAATIPANSPLAYVSQAVIEHIDSPQAILSRGELSYNNIQMWDNAINISYLQNNTNNSYLVRGKEYNSELKKQMEEIKRSFERTLLLGKRQDASGSTLPYAMGGIGYFISQHVTTKSGAYFTESDYLTAAQTALDDVGPDGAADTILLNTFSKQVISSWSDNLRRGTFSDKKVSNIIDSWETEVGTFDFEYSFHMPTNEMWAVNFRDLTRHPYVGMDWTEEPLAKNGMQEVGHVYGAQTLRAPGDRARWKITGYSTTRTDYPTLQTV